MRTLLLLLLFSPPALAGGPRFVAVDGGEVAVDLAVDLSRLPAFQWASDPFLQSSGLGRGVASVEEEEDFKLQAVTMSGEDSIAVVNDRVVRVGDRVGRRTILKIGPTFVLLGEKGSVIEATLDPPKRKERAPASSGAGAAVAGTASTMANPVPAHLRPEAGNPAVSAGQMLNSLLDGQAPAGKKSDGIISIEEVKK